MNSPVRKAAMYTETKQISQEEVVERYGPLVKRIAHHLMAKMPSSVQLDDLLQAGLIGLLEASKNYDMSKGASFETYAGIRIRGSIIDDMRKGDWAPRSVHRNARLLNEGIQNVEKRTGKDASDVEVAEELGISLDEYYKMAQDSSSSKLVSFDEITGADDKPETQIAGNVETPDEEFQKVSLKKRLVECLGTLPERERLVLALYYDEELNLKEIGEVLGVSESRVSQIHSQAAARLRARMSDWDPNSEVQE